jgi:hypothetical protein
MIEPLTQVALPLRDRAEVGRQRTKVGGIAGSS